MHFIQCMEIDCIQWLQLLEILISLQLIFHKSINFDQANNNNIINNNNNNNNKIIIFSGSEM